MSWWNSWTWCRTLLPAGLVLGLLFGVAAAEAGAAPAEPRSTDAAAGGPITREEVLRRARSWLAARVRYANDLYYGNEYGLYRQDCSGFVSMAWRLRTSSTTRNLPEVMVALDRDQLRPGDAFWRRDQQTGHVALFVRWADPDRTRPVVWEQHGLGREAQQRVWAAGYATTFEPRRYREIREETGGPDSRTRSPSRP